LLLVGLTFTFGIWPLGIVWPSGWVWHEGGRSEYLEMILGIYATLGVFLMIASRDPMAHRSLIWFTVWSSIVHGGIMGIQSVANPQPYRASLWGRRGLDCRGGCIGSPDPAFGPGNKISISGIACRSTPIKELQNEH